jgi:hypothetical protein
MSSPKNTSVILDGITFFSSGFIEASKQPGTENVLKLQNKCTFSTKHVVTKNKSKLRSCVCINFIYDYVKSRHFLH